MTDRSRLRSPSLIGAFLIILLFTVFAVLNSWTARPSFPLTRKGRVLQGDTTSNNTDASNSSSASSASYGSTAEYFRSFLEQNKNDNGGADDSYPLHDGVIAAFAQTVFKSTATETVSNEEIKDLLRDCGDEDDNPEDEYLVSIFRQAIPAIIQKAYKRFTTDTGRILEVSQADFELGYNYVTRVQSATLSCFVAVSNDFDSQQLIPEAFASYIVAPQDELSSLPNPAAYAHNLTMFIEADVMELPIEGQYFIPKRYCLEGLNVEQKSPSESNGMSAPQEGNIQAYTEAAIPGYAPGDQFLENTVIDDDASFLDTMTAAHNTKATEHARLIQLGPQRGVLRTRRNRLGRSIAWAHQTNMYPGIASIKDYDWGLIMSAYRTVKIELWGAYEADLFASNHSCTYSPGGISEGYLCLQREIQAILDSNSIDLEASYWGTVSALHAFVTGKDYITNWRAYLREKYDEISDEEIERDAGLGVSNSSNADIRMKLRRSIMYPVPYIFDRNIAAVDKNSITPPIHVNPFDIGSNTKYPDMSEALQNRCSRSEASTEATEFAARLFLAALVARNTERTGKPIDNVGKWKIKDAINQNPGFEEKVTFDDDGNLLPGNLTEGVLGRTAKWLMVTPWLNTKSLQDLVYQSQVTDSVYSETTTEVYDTDNPCQDAATNTDIFIFCFSIVLAGFGAIGGVLRSVHSCFHWWIICCCGRPSKNTTKKNDGWRLFTYEAFYFVLGISIFAGLFAPLLFQTILEFEVANYGSEEVNMEIEYASLNPEIVIRGYNQPVLVTFVHAEAFCKDARPWLLLCLLVVGVVVSVIANTPYLVRVKACCFRPDIGNQVSDHSETEGLTVFSEELRALRPATISDFKPDYRPLFGGSLHHQSDAGSVQSANSSSSQQTVSSSKKLQLGREMIEAVARIDRLERMVISLQGSSSSNSTGAPSPTRQSLPLHQGQSSFDWKAFRKQESQRKRKAKRNSF